MTTEATLQTLVSHPLFNKVAESIFEITWWATQARVQDRYEDSRDFQDAVRLCAVSYEEQFGNYDHTAEGAAAYYELAEDFAANHFEVTV